MIKTKDSYVAYVIDHTSGSCCQRGSTHSGQNHSRGKDFPCELEEVLILLLKTNQFS